MDLKKFLLDHFEKFALGIACAILAGFVFSSLLTVPPAEAAKDKVNDANRRVQSKRDLASRNAPSPEAPVAAREVRVALEGGALPERLPSWLFHKRPVIATKTEGIEIPEPAHAPPIVTNPKGGLGRIGLRWQDDANGNKLVKIDKYEVYRAEREAKPENFKKVATCEATKPSYTDTDVKPRTNYWYLIESHASVDESHPVVQHAKQKAGASGVVIELPAAERVRRSATIGPVTTLPDVYIEVVNVQLKTTPAEIREGKPERKASTFLKVWKYFPEKQRWLDWSYPMVMLLDMVGKVETSGAEKLDFSTDYKLNETKRIRVKKSFGEIEADAVVLEDVKTGQLIEINNQEIDPGLAEVKKNPKPGESRE